MSVQEVVDDFEAFYRVRSNQQYLQRCHQKFVTTGCVIPHPPLYLRTYIPLRLTKHEQVILTGFSDFTPGVVISSGVFYFERES